MLLHRQTDREIYNTTDSTSIFLFCFLFISSLSKILLTDHCNHDLDISHNINNFKLKQNGNFFSSGLQNGLLWGARLVLNLSFSQKALKSGGSADFFAPWTLCDLSDPGGI